VTTVAEFVRACERLWPGCTVIKQKECTIMTDHKTEYDNTNSGALFKNDRKKEAKQPDYTGTLNVDGVEYWVSGWTKVSRRGDKFLSLAVTVKDQKAETGDFLDDDTPIELASEKPKPNLAGGGQWPE
jgi:hypothetical protein